MYILVSSSSITIKSRLDTRSSFASLKPDGGSVSEPDHFFSLRVLLFEKQEGVVLPDEVLDMRRELILIVVAVLLIKRQDSKRSFLTVYRFLLNRIRLLTPLNSFFAFNSFLIELP